MKIKVCMGAKCILMGSMTIYDQIEELIEGIENNSDEELIEKVELEPVKCLDYCKKNLGNVAPVVIVDDEVLFNATGQQVMERIYKLARK